MTLRMYGIPNCDTVKRARTWLDAQGIAYDFADYKKVGADPGKLGSWIEQAGLDKVLNRAGTTFKKLSDTEKAAAADPGKAIGLMVEQPSMIKRPIVEHDGGLLVGFNEAAWATALKR